MVERKTYLTPAVRRVHPIAAGDIEAMEGHMYRVRLPLSPAEGDDLRFPEFSIWRLEEGGELLDLAHATHAEISSMGAGRYSHWHDYLYFSSSDNSDPRSSGRSYRLCAVTPRRLPAQMVRGTARIRHAIEAGARPAAGLFLYSVIKPACWLAYLPEIVFGRPQLDREDFRRFLRTIFDLTEPPWPSMLTEYFRQYVDRSYFRNVRIEDPSLEIAVAEGASSIAYLNYPFTTGTEYMFEFCRQFADRLPHKEFKFFDLKVPSGLPPDTYRTIVMIHSIDDFDSPDTAQAFRSMSHVLRAGGKAYLSGFTDAYLDAWGRYGVYRLLGGRGTFRENRGLHPENLLDERRLHDLCAETGFTLTYYREFTCDSRFKFFYIAEKLAFKLFPLGRLKRALWKSALFRKLHLHLDSTLAAAIMAGEVAAVEKGRRGLNFFCCIEKTDAEKAAVLPDAIH